MKKQLLTVSFLLIVLCSHAQNQQLYFRQFAFNPYLFNPGYVAINDQPEVNAVYRQQWTNFNDAPITSAISLQVPVGNRVALGFNVITDKQVLLRNSTAALTFGYMLPLGEDQSIRFALSGGMGWNKLDLTDAELNMNDETIFEAMNNSYYAMGSFGLVYTFKGLRLGFALPQLFDNRTFIDSDFNEVEISKLDNRLFSASYRFSSGASLFSFEPYILYRQTPNNLQNAWEAATMVHYKESIWGGASYHEHNGLALFLGASFKNRVSFSYSYDFPPFNASYISHSSHELHMNFKFGKKRSQPQRLVKNTVAEPVYTANNDMPQENIQSKEKVHDESAVEAQKGQDNSRAVNTVAQTTSSLPTATDEPPRLEENTLLRMENDDDRDPGNDKKEEVKKGAPARSFTLAPGHYVVVGVFKMVGNSTNFTRELLAKGYQAEVALNPKTGTYYVYVFSSYDLGEARKMRNMYRLKNPFKEAWLYTME